MLSKKTYGRLKEARGWLPSDNIVHAGVSFFDDLWIIAFISESFCGDCNRLRITADGQAFTCLFASEGADLKPVLDNTAALQQRIAGLWLHRSDRYSEERHHHLPRSSHAEMACLGG